MPRGRSLIEAISGKPSGVVLQDLVGGLQTTKVAEPQVVAADDSTHTEPVPESVPESVPDLVCESVSGSPPSADRPTTADAPADVGGDGVPYQIDTIRVDTRKLDDLLRLCGELIVTQQRAARIEDGLDRLNIELNELRQEMLRATRGATDAMPWTEQLAELSARAGGLRDRLGEDSGKLQDLTQQLSDGVRNTRLLPLATLFALFPRMVRDIAQQESKQVELVIEGGATQADKQVIEQLKDPLMHVLRNAVHHGIETPEQRRIAGKPERGMIRISAQRLGSVLHIEVGDDGRGVDSGQVRSALRRLSSGRREATTDDKAKVSDDGHPEAREHLLESLFLPGLTTEQMITDVSGRGVGLDVVRTSIDALKGSIQARSTPGDGFQLALELPGTLATTRILLLQVGEFLLGLPMDAVQTLFRLNSDSRYILEGRPTLDYAGQAVSVMELARLLELGAPTFGDDGPDACIVIGQHERQVALLVDAVVGTQEVLLKPLGGVLRRVPGIAGATILSSGEVCPILAATDLIKAVVQADPRTNPQASGRSATSTGSNAAAEQHMEGNARQHHLLLADDSMLTRVQEKRLLESAGYRVTIAVDGLQALARLRAPAAQVGSARAGQPERFDAVITDVNMPRMDGLRLTEQIRADPRLRSLPVVLVTSLASEADQRRGLEAGANAYITKGGFDNRLLLSTLERLI